MTWLLKLYPPRWRRRYGAELTALVAAQRFSIGAACDLMAGAVDAWLHPQLAAADPTLDAKGDATMIAKMMRLTCAGYGPAVTSSDRARSAAVNIWGTLGLALLWLVVSWQFRGNLYVTALWPMAFLLPSIWALHYTSLKGRSARAQTIFIAGFSAALVLFFLGVAWLSTVI